MRTALLLSGGIDSTSIAYWKNPHLAITINYGQKSANAEIRASSAIAKHLNINHEIIEIDCSSLGSGDLAGTEASDLASASDWWPFRNQLIITLALMKCVTHKINKLIIGTVSTDATHLDGSKNFIENISRLSSSQEGSITIDAPAINLTSHQLAKKSGIPISILSWSHSCHTSEYACGTCRGCNKHRETMLALGYGNY
jgi:7-cyano-7-deazaguanine synthase